MICENQYLKIENSLMEMENWAKLLRWVELVHFPHLSNKSSTYPKLTTSQIFQSCLNLIKLRFSRRYQSLTMCYLKQKQYILVYLTFLIHYLIETLILILTLSYLSHLLYENQADQLS